MCVLATLSALPEIGSRVPSDTAHYSEADMFAPAGASQRCLPTKTGSPYFSSFPKITAMAARRGHGEISSVRRRLASVVRIVRPSPECA